MCAFEKGHFISDNHNTLGQLTNQSTVTIRKERFWKNVRALERLGTDELQ